MGDGEKASLRLQFNPKIRLEFHGSTITTDAGLLAFREFDDALGLTEITEDYLQESRTGRNILHHLVPLLRQQQSGCCFVLMPPSPSRRYTSIWRPDRSATVDVDLIGVGDPSGLDIRIKNVFCYPS